MEEDRLATRVEKFIRQKYKKRLLKAVEKGGKSLNIDFEELDRFDESLGVLLLDSPNEILDKFDKAIKEITDLGEEEEIVRARFYNLPRSRNIRIRKLRAKHMGKFLEVDGVVKRASEVMPEISVTTFRCPDCDNRIMIEQKDRTIKEPNFCACGYRGKFELQSKELFDVRWIMVDEPFEITTGERPSEMKVYLKEDLTTPRMQNKTDPGNKIKITGTLKEVQKTIKGKKTVSLDRFLDANHIESSEIEWDDLEITKDDIDTIAEFSKDPDIYQKLIASVASSIYGMEDVKEAIILQMFGGVKRILQDGTKIRGDIHILAIGDPAAGKSQLLKLASTIMPRSRYVSGKGVTGAGLTCSVTKDEEMGGWVLEAGALVLTNKGLLAIDEFEKMDKDDMVAMHEALEQGTISIAKASIVATLPAEAAVLAGGNPKYSRFDPYRPITEQINLPETILSRFDLKFALRDIPDAAKDSLLAEHILKARDDTLDTAPVIDTPFLKKYISYAKKNTSPELTKEAKDMLLRFYVDMRAKAMGGDSVPITLRQYEALIRLSEASAKIRLATKVKRGDAQRAIRLMKVSLGQLGFDPETGKIDIDRAEGGMPSSKRSKIRMVLDLIDEMQAQFDEGIPLEDFIDEARREGIERAEDVIRSLKNDGMIYEPKPGYIKKV